MHDANGKPVKVGDKVNIPATITETYATDEYCSIQVKPDHPMYPSDRRDAIVLNSRQVVLVED
jgi:hypothetical protein